LIEKGLEYLQRVVYWMASRPNRLRLRGTRIEVVAFVLCREPIPTLLLARTPYRDGVWSPPQEGVQLAESLQEAVERCLRTECSVALQDKPLHEWAYLRSIQFLGTIPLPPGRWGERPVADDAAGTLLEAVELRRKAYWRATLIVRSQEEFACAPDGREVTELRWCSLDEARSMMVGSNRVEKAGLLVRGLEKCLRDLHGADSADERG
jgi:ADP-ribose pyrophosphatase YjhB (NUDIX family)